MQVLAGRFAPDGDGIELLGPVKALQDKKAY